MKTKVRSFCFVYDCTRTARAVPYRGVYIQRGVFVLLFISFMVFGDTSNMMSVDKSLRFSCIH